MSMMMMVMVIGDGDGGKVKVKAGKGEQATGRLHRPVWVRKRKSLFLAIPFHGC